MRKEKRIPQQQRAIETKRHIVEAAVRLFSDKGYHQTSSNEISKEAGVSIGCFYSYFKDKKQLFIESIHYYGNQVRDGMDTIPLPEKLTPDTDREKKISEYIRTVIQAHKINPAFHREMEAMSMMDEDIHRIIGEQEALDMARFYDLLYLWRDEVKVDDLHAASALVFFTAEKIAHAVIFSESPVPEERLVGELSQMILVYLF